MFLAMGASGYGRLDVRMNAACELFDPDTNPNGGILYLPEEIRASGLHDPLRCGWV